MNYRHLSIILTVFINQFLVYEAVDVNAAFGFVNVSEILLQFGRLSTFPKNECYDQLTLVAGALTRGDEWVIRMIDATAKPQSGLLMGNIMQVGNYDECLKIQSSNGVRGKYCTVLYNPHEKYGQELNELLSSASMPGNNKIEEGHFTTDAKKSYGICIPKVCTAEDLQTLANQIEEGLKSPFHFHFVNDFCVTEDGLPFNISAIIAIIIFGLFALIIICSTLYEILFCQKFNEKTPNLYTSFSIITNGKRLLSTSTSEGTLSCLNGIRVISMMWIVLGHRFMYNFFFPQINAIHIFEWRNATENALIASASYAVDTFFVISGLLVVYLFMKNREKGIKFSIPMFYAHRIIRLTPSLAMAVLFSATLMKHMGSGPFWPAVDEMFQKPCERHWWTTLTYLNNYVSTNDQCVGQSWYLAVDTQMYVLSPLVLLPLVRWPRRTILAILVFVILNCSYVFEITWKKELAILFFDQDEAQYKYIYSPTHVRGTAYLIGMVFGYFIFETRTRPLKLSKLALFCIWSCSLLVLLTIVFSHAHFLRSKIDVLEASFFNSLSRVSWSTALCVIIVLCVNGYGGIINSFLSSKIFVVLIRLNYNIYLLHLSVVIAVVAQGRTPSHFSNLSTLHNFWGDYMFTVAAAVVWTLSFESPILILEKIIFGGRKKLEQVVVR